MNSLNVNAVSRLEEINRSLNPLICDFQKSFASGNISEAQKDLALKEVGELRKKFLVADNLTLNSQEISSLSKCIQAKLMVFGEKDTKELESDFSKNLDDVMKLAKNVDDAVVKKIIFQRGPNSSAAISITSAHRKMVQEFFSQEACELLLPFQKAEQYLHLLFCERTVVSGVEIFNREISRSQQQELKSFIEKKKQECVAFLQTKKTELETSEHLESLFLKALGYIEMEEISTI